MGRPLNKDKRSHILKVAYQMYGEYGCENVTTRQLAEACNVSRALLHHYYSTMNELNLQIIVRIQNSLREYLESRLPIRYQDVGFGFFYKFMLLEVFKKCKLFQAYLNIQLDADMLWRMQTESFIGVDNRNYGPELFNRHLIADGLNNSTIAQLTRCKERGLLHYSDREIIGIGFKTYFAFMDVPRERYEAVQKQAEQFVNEEWVDEFIRFYEREFGWNS